MRPKVVLFGDSITEEAFTAGGWASDLANHFSRTADVVLRGYIGYNTRWALQAMADALDGIATAQRPPAAVTLFFGANDASLPTEPAVSSTSPPTSTVQTSGPSAPLSRNPFGENPSGLPERTNESAGAYAKACIGVAKESSIPVIDIWSKMQQFPCWEKSLLRDGLHLTPGGNRVLFEELIDCFRREGLSIESLPTDQPLYTVTLIPTITSKLSTSKSHDDGLMLAMPVFVHRAGSDILSRLPPPTASIVDPSDSP